jgi:amino-acid N-acetyltransferase
MLINWKEYYIMKYRSPVESELLQIEQLLRLSGLPYEDCSEHFDNFLIAEVSGRIVATGAFELYGEVSLLRSIAVLNEYKGQNIGSAIYSELKAKALSLGVREIYLLTETAELYFRARNFSEIDRTSVPVVIKQTKQFSSLCPTSATVMRLVL